MKSFRSLFMVTASTCLLTAMSILASTPALAASPFNNISGRWSGFGWVYLFSGDRERVRCRATYRARSGGKVGSQDLRCGSTSGYNIKANSQMRYSGGSVSGNWTEENFGASGTVSGAAGTNSMNLQLAGGGLNAAMNVNFNRCKQNVSIALGAGEIQRIEIAMKRC